MNLEVNREEYESFVHNMVKYQHVLPYTSMEVETSTSVRADNGTKRFIVDTRITKQLTETLWLYHRNIITEKNDSCEYFNTTIITVASPKKWFLTINISQKLRWFVDGDKDVARRDIIYLKMLMGEMQIGEEFSDKKVVQI